MISFYFKCIYDISTYIYGFLLFLNVKVRNHTSRVDRVDATHIIRDLINILNDNGNLLMFLQRAGHMMDGYLQEQVGPQP